MKIAVSVTCCKECPNREYESGGIYLCSKTRGDVTTRQFIPDWCPLPDYPMTPTPQREPMTGAQVRELADDGAFFGNVYEIVRAIEAHHGIKGVNHG